jgi:hypothetical protein
VEAALDGEDADPVQTTRPEEDEERRRPPSGDLAKPMVRRRIGADLVWGNREEAAREEEQPHRIPHHSTTAGLSREWVEKQARRSKGEQRQRGRL